MDMMLLAISFTAISIFQLLLAFLPQLKGKARWGDSTDGPKMSVMSHLLFSMVWILVVAGSVWQMLGHKYSSDLMSGFIILFALIVMSGLYDSYRDRKRPK
jgi:hypothetical protein